MTTNHVKAFWKIKPLIMLGIINVLIISVVIYVYSIHKETTNIWETLPSDWLVTNESWFFSHGTFWHEITVQSKKTCTVPAYTEKWWTTRTQKTIFPNIIIRFDALWSIEDIQKAEMTYKKCQEELQDRPMVAKSCQKTTPDFITKHHAVFIERADCFWESAAIIKKIEAYYSSNQ